ncbi:hypothetical protein LTR64_008663 [Lithohypha guttulata]|uniref:uncharacterized protein n=1 Tax=Lithohypha guttulata TaxID=1690604 RepID=UPI002DDDED25|nr:hypothetical protein LTR51_008730 [Lithohypha guttulata]
MSTASNETYGPIVPEGQHAPFAVVTPDQHAAWIIIATAVGMSCSLFFGLIRFGVRKWIAPKFGLDDYTLGGSSALMVIQSAILLGACSNGLGNSIDLITEEAQAKVQSLYYASNLFFILALGLSKVSVVFFLRRISRAKHHKLAYDVVIGLHVLWTVGSFLALALQCDLSSPWTVIGRDCGTGVLRRWQVICALDIISELLIVSMAVYLVWGLQTSLEQKVVVVGVFGFRLIGIIAIAFRLRSFDAAGFSTNPFLLEADFICWTQSELNWSIISATIPSFQNFLKNLNTHFGGLAPGESDYGYGSHSRSRVGNNTVNASFQMSQLQSTDDTAREKEDQESAVPPRLRPKSSRDIGSLVRKNSVNDAETRSIGSNESRRMMIKKEVNWQTTVMPSAR